MTYQIALPPDQERKLVPQARGRGLDATDYLRQIVTSALDGTSALTLGTAPRGGTVGEWLDGLTEGHEALSTLDASAVTRERLYADHD